MYSRTLLDILFLIWGQTVADYKILSFHLSINVIIIVVSFKILDLCPIALFQQLWNTLYFMIKNSRFTQKTPDNKSKLAHSENTLKLRCNAKHRHCATHCKPETKKIGGSSNACVCLCRSMKLLTDDHKDFAAGQLQTYYIALRNLIFN